MLLSFEALFRFFLIRHQLGQSSPLCLRSPSPINQLLNQLSTHFVGDFLAKIVSHIGQLPNPDRPERELHKSHGDFGALIYWPVLRAKNRRKQSDLEKCVSPQYIFGVATSFLFCAASRQRRVAKTSENFTHCRRPPRFGRDKTMNFFFRSRPATLSDVEIRLRQTPQLQ
jgi:hypothetical protein